MTNENEEVFKNAEKTDAVEESVETPAIEEVEPESDNKELIEEDFKPKISSESQTEKDERTGIKKVMNGEILTITKVEILPPKTKQLKDGKLVPLEPNETLKAKAKYYSSKLKVWFAEQNIVEYYPSIAFWINDGVIDPNVRFDRNGNSKVSQICRMTLAHMSGGKIKLKLATINDRPVRIVTEETKVEFDKLSKITSDQQIINYLVGKKVKIETVQGNYNGTSWFRNDFLELK